MAGKRTLEFYLTLVRHGQTEANVRKLIQGHSNTPLTELGIQQVHQLANYFNSGESPINFRRIYSSDLGRAYETSAILAHAKWPITTDNRLRERKYGHYEGEPISKLLEDAYRVGLDESNFTRYTPEGAESMDAVRLRVIDFCNQALLHDCHPNEEVLVVSHWAVIKEFLKIFQPLAGGSIGQSDIVETKNAAFSRFKVTVEQPLASEMNGNNSLTTLSSRFLRVDVLGIHQTPHLDEKQISVNLRQCID